jgi:hypothetical protein
MYYWLLKTKPTKIRFGPAKQDKDSEIDDEHPMVQYPQAEVQPPQAMIQSPKSKVQTPTVTAFPCAINSTDYSDDDFTTPPETPPVETPLPDPRLSWRTTAIVSISMMIEQGPKTFHAELNAEDAERWKEAINKEVASMESHEVFTFVEKIPEGA